MDNAHATGWGLAVKGFVETPPDVVDVMVHKLFRSKLPATKSRVLDPGCGNGAFIDGIVRWCRQNSRRLPLITGIEADRSRSAESARKFGNGRSSSLASGNNATFLARVVPALCRYEPRTLRNASIAISFVRSTP